LDEQDKRISARLSKLKQDTGQDASPDDIVKQTAEVQQELVQQGLSQTNLDWRFCYDFFSLLCYSSGVQKVLEPSYLHTALVVASWPLRRTLDRPLGNVIIRYGSTGNEEAFLDPDTNAPNPNKNSATIIPTVSNELFVYLDKQVSGLFPHLFDKSNRGIAKITVTAHSN